MGTALLIDVSPLLYAVANTPVGSFTTKAGEPTGIRFGVLRSIRSYTEQTRADKTVLCYDFPGQVEKAKNVPEYKANRKWTDEKQKMYDQVPGLKALVGLTKYAQIEAEGYEADDVIGCVAKKLSAQGHTVLIVTPDNDMLQLLCYPAISIWMPAQPKKDHKKPWYKDEDYIMENYGVGPSELLLWRAIEGDKSDNLPGVKLNTADRLNLRTALREQANQKPSLTHLGMFEFDQMMKGEFQNPPGSSLQVLSVFRDRIERNFRMMELMDPPNLAVTKGKADVVALCAEFKRLEMKSLVGKSLDFTGVNSALVS